MNGNYKADKKKGIYTRCQTNALNFIAKMLENKDTAINWTDFLKANFPNLKADRIRKIADKDKDNYPEQFHDLLLKETDRYCLLLYILCWSVFGEQIEKCYFKPSSEYSKDSPEVVFSTEEELLDHMFSEKENIECIEMAYHGGFKWLYYAKRITMLNDYLAGGGKMRVIVNSSDAAEIAACHIRNPETYYISFEKNIDSWKEFAARHSGSVELVVSDIPLLHSYINFRTDPSERSRMLIIFYTYANSDLSRNHHLFLEENSPLYKLYQEEFEYLWKNKDYKR